MSEDLAAGTAEATPQPPEEPAGPRPDLTILEARVYRGPNYWSYDKAIHLLVDLGSLEDFPSNTIPGFNDRLLELLPGLF
jgi:cyanophycin synthetase